MFKQFSRIALSLSLGLVIVVVLISSLQHVGAAAVPVASAPQNRAEDPVIVAGSQFTDFLGVPLNELVLYTYEADAWQPVPFQFDERNITGTYVISEDGVLDINDELVFMAGDAGALAAGRPWPNDAVAQSHVRYLVTVADPLQAGDTGWAYLYRSPTLMTSTVRYVDWDVALQQITAVSYTAAFDPSTLVGFDSMTLNGSGVDVLDRQKIRVSAVGGLIQFDEEDLITLITPTVDIPIVGPVRAVNNEGALNLAIYGSRLEFFAIFDASGLPVSPDSLRTSLDYNDPTVTGLTQYFDSNGTAAAIDGMPDTVAATPVVSWYQVSGAAGGLAVVIPTVNAVGGTVETYYKDDSTFDPNDTGDGLSYADTGFMVTNPGTVVDFLLASFVLPPNATTSVGAQYAARFAQPLQARTTAQTFSSGFDNCDPDVTQPSGSIYRFCLPPGWNGNVLMVYAHGYVFFNEPVAIPEDQICLGEPGNETCINNIVNDFGIAFATSSYPLNGLAVLPAVDDMINLVQVFSATYGMPDTVVIAGVSEGGLVTTLALEQHPDVFDGGLAACGPIGSFGDQINYFGDFRMLMDYYFPGILPATPITIPNQLITDWITTDYFSNVVAPVIFDPANNAALTDLLAVSNLPHIPGVTATISTAVAGAMNYNIMTTNEVMAKLGGNPFDNATRTYTGSSDDAALNAGITRYSADPAALAALQAYETTGFLERPLVTLHTSQDPIVPQWHEVLYGAKAAPHSWMYVVDHPVPVDNYGHCNFDVDGEILPAFITMLGLVADPPHRTLLYLPVVRQP